MQPQYATEKQLKYIVALYYDTSSDSEAMAILRKHGFTGDCVEPSRSSLNCFYRIAATLTRQQASRIIADLKPLTEW